MDKELLDYLKCRLTYCSMVGDKSMREQMYADYQKQTRAKGLEPVEMDRIIFLSSGISFRDEDADFSPVDVKAEATNLWGFLIKNHGINQDTVVLSIGFDPTLYVVGDEKTNTQHTQTDGKGF